MNAHKSRGMSLFSVGLGLPPRSKLFKIRVEDDESLLQGPLRHRSLLQMLLMHENLFLPVGNKSQLS
jgi:hypothetical protein